MALHLNSNTATSEIIEYFLHNGVKKDGFCTDLVKHGLRKRNGQGRVKVINSRKN